jgi:hypothetical protein
MMVFTVTVECQGCDVFFFSIVSRPLKCCSRGTDRRRSEAALSVKPHVLTSMNE